MDSPTPISRYVAQNSKKRAFSGESSSSGFKDGEVLEASPPINNTSLTMSVKQEEVVHHEIIDMNMEEDSGDEVLINGEVHSSDKGKEPLSNLANDGSGSDDQMSDSGNLDDNDSDLLYEDDEWMDDIMYDDDYVPESQFDHMDIPSGVEVPFPWLPSYPKNNSKLPTADTSSSSSSQLNLNGAHLSPQSSAPLSLGLESTTSSSSNICTKAARQHHNLKQASKSLETDLDQYKSATSSSQAYLGSDFFGDSLQSNNTKFNASHAYSSPLNQFPHLATPPSFFGSQSAFSKLGMASNAPGTWLGLTLDITKPSQNLIGDNANNQNGETPVRIDQGKLDEMLRNFDHFKKFDSVEDFSDHHFCKYGASIKQAPKSWAKKIQNEWKILEKDLPDTIFVRVFESRMDLLTAVIIGAEGTPYHNGLFFFDVFFPSAYPNVPPHVHYHSGGLRINPNLYNCGKVCLSLLNTWEGRQQEKWIPGKSTMLQVLVSIQGLILNTEPYYNEPGYERLSGTKSGDKESSNYSEKTLIYSLQTMVYSMKRPPKNFEALVIGHFNRHARDILLSCKAYLNGAQVGSLVNGVVQNGDKGDKSCSKSFQSRLSGFMTTLVNTFIQIGAKDCEEFLPLAPKKKE